MLSSSYTHLQTEIMHNMQKEKNYYGNRKNEQKKHHSRQVIIIVADVYGTSIAAVATLYILRSICGYILYLGRRETTEENDIVKNFSFIAMTFERI